ncbi:sigma-54-dependent Fis family transcriptional regulator [Sphingorhabdus lutea]|uniref:DNA-binding transcriptional regulator NtrC n=1 Tax=Sphingorhabdus lutea TaxID=1913578 RepID=A0A1L3JBT8_9SPHN|nr:sigma-54 dependent transcriptional regulator [Sphingorhabdus lutea]APG62523.1 sigma-54-dependent Fis family transcriptional regulator [Sphingorhabdus lutea]
MSENTVRLLMLVDDEPAQCRFVTALASRAGWRTIIARDSETAIAMLGTQDGMMLDAILMDQWVPGSECAELIAELKSRRPALPIILMTSIGSTESAVEAMRAGASDYVTKPVAPERLMEALNLATDQSKKMGELHPMVEKNSQPLEFEEIVGAAPAFRAALAVAAKAARSKAPIYIEGEGGVGKEVIADAIQITSSRSKMPFLKLNCGALSPSLLDSILFGHEKNSFTGAFERRIGLIQQADGGTLFIDEIEKLPPETQLRLVRLLTKNEIQPIGCKHSYQVDVRIISASDKALAPLLEKGEFREDLFYRLNVVNLSIPPLRERTGDIAALARHFLTRLASQPGLRSLGITDEALNLLRHYNWPGNVRQLQSVLFRAAVLCDRDALTVEEFPQIKSALQQSGMGQETSNINNDGIGVTLYESDGNMRPLEEIEADVIRLAIGHYRGRMTEVARRLGIGRSTLYRKLSELGIDNAA